MHALFPRPRTSQPHPAHRIYPYLLRDLPITRPNHVWCTDVTYIPLQRGFLYLVAVMDWASRKVLSWRLSNTLDASFCVEALHAALECYGPPEIFNSDQGSQFTSVDFTDVLKEAGIRISMDGTGRWMDNRSGPRKLDSGLSEISIVFQAAVPRPVAPKYTTSGVR